MGGGVGDRAIAVTPLASGDTTAVRAKYVVGCEGARSRTRAAIGRELTGDATNESWGVMDVLAVTDFPDIRVKCAIYSAEEGNILIIPREGGHLVRLYIELDEVTGLDRRSATPERIAALQAQLFYLLNRHRQQSALRQADLFSQSTICDYVFDKDKIFAYLNLDDSELLIYDKIYALLESQTPKPDLVIFLQADTERLIERIKRRKRDYVARTKFDRAIREGNGKLFDYVQEQRMVRRWAIVQ